MVLSSGSFNIFTHLITTFTHSNDPTLSRFDYIIDDHYHNNKEPWKLEHRDFIYAFSPVRGLVFKGVKSFRTELLNRKTILYIFKPHGQNHPHSWWLCQVPAICKPPENVSFALIALTYLWPLTCDHH